MTTPIPVKPFTLDSGSHRYPAAGACFNELASLLAGEPFSDAPACVSPVVRRFGMVLNDRLDDERRQLLRPFVLRSLGTAGDGRDQERVRMCNEWLLRRTLPPLLDAAGRPDAAQSLRGLPADLTVENVRRAIWQARDDAWEARQKAMRKLRDRIRAELAKRAADADAIAADADAIAIAAAAIPAAVAVAAVAAADAAGDVSGGGYWKVYGAVKAKVREIIQPKVHELVEPLFPSALELLDRMLPESPVTELLAVPLQDAQVICGVSQPEAA